jgi:23S rRNA pseudouridine1911/1915/1917 synthase
VGKLELRAPEAAAGTRLDRYLASLDDVGSRSRARDLIDSGGVRVDGRRPRAGTVVRGGELLEIELPDQDPAPIAPTPSVVFGDDSLVVVNKPAGLVVHPAPGQRSRSLVEIVSGLEGGADAIRPGVVHRLDKDTSGLMILARSERAHRHLSAQIRRREVRRVYLALVEGRMDARSGTIDAPLGRDRQRPERMAVAGQRSREARTHFEVVELLARHTLVRVRLETGRTHQIRAHFAEIGHPLAGDPRYRSPGAGRSGEAPMGSPELGLARQFLHSTELGFRHPADGRPMEFSSPIPQDLQRALEAAREAG